MKTTLFLPTLVSFIVFLLRPTLCRPGQCFSGQKDCNDRPASSNQPIEVAIDRGYQILCGSRNGAVQAVLQQVFSGISQLQSDLTDDFADPTPPPASSARDAFLQGVSAEAIKPLLQRILVGAKLRPPRVPPTIDENAELRSTVAKTPRPHIVCATPETSRIYGEVSPDYYGFCTKPKFGLPLSYTENGDTIFLCPRFFTELATWKVGEIHCPEISNDGRGFASTTVRGKPAQDWFVGWQHLQLFRELVKIYLGDQALTGRSNPPAQTDWNACLDLEDDDARNNPSSWVLWMAAVQQRCTEFPSSSYSLATYREGEPDTFNRTGLVDPFFSEESYTPDDIFQSTNLSVFPWLFRPEDRPGNVAPDPDGQWIGSPSRSSPPPRGTA